MEYVAMFRVRPIAAQLRFLGVFTNQDLLQAKNASGLLNEISTEKRQCIEHEKNDKDLQRDLKTVSESTVPGQ